ncbi:MULTISPECIES: ATP-binding protein [unclassified Sphingobium]|uniref:ATP-binding protein n=1 Tax=unclassified Sphingobium TaxID=2611147 RepID=UPI002224A1EB|nr:MULTISPECIES: ATP-binding protein [unclassified Sphingobium]MCW2412617.1 signal transduction histidine kinase [Sphingobium sp. B8D3D]MCW2415086.1 signal transduction histidine kinase [Sphingobium sp. B8D3A]
MTVAPPGTEPILARLDGDGRIISADAPLARLQADAGGDPHGPLAIPALAALVRLAARLRIPISRAVQAAQGEADLSMWVQIRPEADGYSMSIVDWQVRAPRQWPGELGVLMARRLAPAEPGWPWQVDTQLRFRQVAAEAAAIGHEPPRDGEPLTAYFRLDAIIADDVSPMPLVEALALRMPFTDQHARLRADGAVSYRISGEPLFDEHGALMGYRGRAVPQESQPAQEPRVEAEAPSAEIHDLFGDGMFDAGFAPRLDRALRQPIGRIIANAGSIAAQAHGELREEYAGYGADIAQASRHLLDLVDDLSDLHAIERPDFRVAKERVDLADLARRAAGLLHVRAGERGIRIQTPPLGESAMACGEYRRVLQILVNLIGNAVRHTPRDSTIWVRVDSEGGRARVVVADQGGGIDPADHQRIFERFERLGLSGGDGSGLGLYISRRLARAMNGDLTVESALGQGARFTLDLPVWADA